MDTFGSTQKAHLFHQLTYAVEVVIFDPPALPIASTTLLSESMMIVGHIDDNGRFPGWIKFAWLELFPGRAKTCIISFKRMPVFLDRSLAPSL